MSNENKPNWSDLQNEQAYTNAWQIDKIWMTAKKLPVYFWVMFILLTATLLNTLRLHYDMEDMVNAELQKTEMNRELAQKYNENRDEREAALRDHIEKLNSDVEIAQKQKRTLAETVHKLQKLSGRQSAIIAKAKAQDLADQMLSQAYQTIAMNAVPLNLQQYIGVASNEQWVGYAEMAAERNAYNVIKTIASIPELMKIDEVAAIVKDYSLIMGLADQNK